LEGKTFLFQVIHIEGNFVRPPNRVHIQDATCLGERNQMTMYFQQGKHKFTCLTLITLLVVWYLFYSC